MDMSAGGLVACERPVTELASLWPGHCPIGADPEVREQACLDGRALAEPPAELDRLVRASWLNDSSQGVRKEEMDGSQEPGPDQLPWAGAGVDCAERFPLSLLLVPLDDHMGGGGACDCVDDSVGRR
jgi:hypothetical protein